MPHVTLKSIANNPDIREGMSREQIDAAIAKHADSELLYDQPYEDSKKVRVAGPFTVRACRRTARSTTTLRFPRRSPSVDGDSTHVVRADAARQPAKRAGVQNGRRAERFEFDEVERVPGSYVAARAVPRGDLADERVAISIGPRYGTVGADWIKAAAREAMRGAGHDVLLVLGFAFDPRALETVEEFKPDGDDGFAVQAEHQAGTIRVLLVRVNTDLAMGEALLKKTKAANLFTVFGEPDVSEPQWTEDGWVVSIRGFDVYNPVTGEVRPGSEDDIAMWMIDTDYDEESFFVRHAYFLGTDPYDRLKKALKADIDPEAWESLNSATSRPFAAPVHRQDRHQGDQPLRGRAADRAGPADPADELRNRGPEGREAVAEGPAGRRRAAVPHPALPAPVRLDLRPDRRPVGRPAGQPRRRPLPRLAGAQQRGGEPARS